MNRIKEINEKLRALEAEINTASQERLAEIDAEGAKLRAEREQLMLKEREAARNAFANASQKSAESTESDNGLGKMSKREKLAFALGKQARRVPLTEVEKRALGVALSTTASTYVAATAELDGVNNAGVLIPTNLVFDLLKDEGIISPIFRDISFSNVPGLVEFPYRKSRDSAKTKAEAASGKMNQMEWAKISGSKGVLQTIIAVTDELRALTDFDFGAYILAQILQDAAEDWTSELIYGTGADERIKGITVGATAAVSGGYAAGKAVDAIVEGIKLCKGKFRRGAKIYIAQDVYDEIAFAADEVGNFKYQVVNNTLGIKSFATFAVEVDESLNAGEFVIGNVSKYFKANVLENLKIETERDATKRITYYIAGVFSASTPFPGAFIHGTKKA